MYMYIKAPTGPVPFFPSTFLAEKLSEIPIVSKIYSAGRTPVNFSVSRTNFNFFIFRKGTKDICFTSVAMELPCTSKVLRQNLMLPPPPGTFHDREDLIKHVRDFGVRQGYVVTIKKSKREKRVILGCDRGGIYRNRRKTDESKRKRSASSRLINCPFEAVGKRDDDVWVLTIKNSEHNHEPLKDMSEHPYSRRFTEEEVQQIKQMTEAGAKPLQVLKALKQSNPDLQSTPRHLYNAKAKIRQGLSEKSFKSWRPNLSVPESTSTEKLTRVCPVTNYIGGKFLESQACAVIDVINPATQEVVSQVPMTTFEEFKAAVVAAKQAFPAWKNTAVSTRQRIMFKLQELIYRDIDKIVDNITTEQGKTFSSAKSDLLYGLELVGQVCGMAATLQSGKYVPNAANGIDAFCIREPLGVCAGICLSNFPAMIPLWMFPIAVTCGNTFILKPSETNPGASMIIASLAAEAGLPDGVLNIVHGNHEIINNICDDDDIKAISLFSSNTAGMHIHARAAARGKRIQCNLEIKNHIVIMPDASADATLDAILASGFGASGIQSIAVFVGGSAPWEQELVERAKLLKVNAGIEAVADIGPVICKESRDQLCRLVQGGIQSGARLVLDGRHIVVPRYEQGNFMGPTIMCDVTTSMDCYKEDMVGPVLLCMQAETLEEAIAIVHKSKHGNGASIFTSSCIAARKFQNEVETCQVGINVPLPLSMPFSSYNGSKTSFGKVGVHFYTLKKSVVQRWKELPRRQVSLPHPSTSETGISNQRISVLQHPASERDQCVGAVSPTSPTASKELPNHVCLPFPPPAEEDFTISEDLTAVSCIVERELPLQEEPVFVHSPSKRYPMNQKSSIVRPSATPWDSTGRGMPNFTRSSTSDRIFSPQMSEWGETPMVLQRSENMLSTSGRLHAPLNSHERIDMVASALPSMDINAATTPTERFYIPTTCSNDSSTPMSLRNEHMGMMSLRHDMHRADINLHPISERVYMPLMSQQNENVVPTSQRPEVALQSTPGSIYLSISQRNDDVGSISLHTDASVYQASGSLDAAHSSSMATPQTRNAVPPISERMYLPSSIQRNDGVASTSERIFIPSTSQEQEMYVQTPIISPDEYRGH